MIYATDLDRTLIYSERFIEEHPVDCEMVLVDRSKISSYISRDVLNKLLTLDSRIRVIPVTARNISEYSRIKIPGFNPNYAITTCGGIILYNNKRLTEWDRYLESYIDMDEQVDVYNDLKEISEYTPKYVDNRYIFTKANNRERAKGILNELREKYKSYKFLMDKHKVYGIPNVVSKSNALRFLKILLNEDSILATGDGALDLHMVASADIGVMPSHKYISDGFKDMGGYIVVNGGVMSPLNTFKIAEDSLANQAT